MSNTIDFQPLQEAQYFNFASDVIDHWALDANNKPALLWVDDNGNEVSRSFKEISDASKRVANLLTSHGIKQGDTVLIILGREIAWWEVITGNIRMGAVVSPGTIQLSAKDLHYRINAAQASCVIINESVADKIDGIASACPSLRTKIIVDGNSQRDGWVDYAIACNEMESDFMPVKTQSDDDALCYFTSGTTGYPKMTIHCHGYALGHITTGKYWLDLTAQDLHWNISDTGWAKAAWSSYFAPWLMGSCLFVHHSTGFDAVKILQLLSSYPITTMCSAPTVYRLLVREDLTQYSFNSLRHCVGAGEPLNPEVIETWKNSTNVTIKDGYGQTETILLCGNLPNIETRFGSMGKAPPGINLDIIDDSGNLVANNTEGDIALKVKPNKPNWLFKGYKGASELTAASFRGDWYITGDRAIKDDDGYFWFVGRSDDVILSSGYRIGPFEVESALLKHPAVIESAVVSSPDLERGEIVKAFVIIAKEYQATDALIKELQHHVKSLTAPYKYPRKIEFIESLPKTVSGKIRRVELRNQEWL